MMYDVVVIGGGPGGSMAAVRLARHGHSVLVLERLDFPRFHIGESMLTYTKALMDRLGYGRVLAQAGFPIKTGAEFCNSDSTPLRVDFSGQGGGRVLTSYQVERAIFDSVLLDRARNHGATVLHQARVVGVDARDGRVTGVTYVYGVERHTVSSRMVIDASGRAGVVSSQWLRARTMNPRLRMVAVFRHFSEIDAASNPGVDGDIQIGSHDDGWVWAIPIQADKLSVGAVMSPDVLKRSPSAGLVFDDHVRRISRIQQRLRGAVPVTAIKVETDFSYHTTCLAGDGYFVVGDAGCFVDPIFSAGVYLAMVTGMRAADYTTAILGREIDEADGSCLYRRFYLTGYDTYFRLIYAFYEHRWRLLEFLKSTGVRVDPTWVTRLLNGDFWSRSNALADYLRGISRYDTFPAFEPLYGCPVYPELDAEEALGLPLESGPRKPGDAAAN